MLELWNKEHTIRALGRETDGDFVDMEFPFQAFDIGKPLLDVKVYLNDIHHTRFDPRNYFNRFHDQILIDDDEFKQAKKVNRKDAMLVAFTFSIHSDVFIRLLGRQKRIMPEGYFIVYRDEWERVFNDRPFTLANVFNAVIDNAKCISLFMNGYMFTSEYEVYDQRGEVIDSLSSICYFETIEDALKDAVEMAEYNSNEKIKYKPEDFTAKYVLKDAA